MGRRVLEPKRAFPAGSRDLGIHEGEAEMEVSVSSHSPPRVPGQDGGPRGTLCSGDARGTGRGAVRGSEGGEQNMLLLWGLGGEQT